MVVKEKELLINKYKLSRNSTQSIKKVITEEQNRNLLLNENGDRIIVPQRKQNADIITPTGSNSQTIRTV